MMAQIKHHVTGAVLYASGKKTTKEVVIEAVLRGSDLSGSDLSWSNLRGSDLRGSNLRGSDLSGSDLSWSDLRGSDLSWSNLSWSDHTLLSEILWRNAGEDLQRQMLAAWVGRKTGWCWSQFIAHPHPKREWALDTLADWVRDGDDSPQVIRDRANALKTPRKSYEKEERRSPD